MPVVVGTAEEIEDSQNISLNKSTRTADRAIDMAFRREIDHRLRAVFVKQLGDQCLFTDVALHKLVARSDGLKILFVAGIGEGIESDDFVTFGSCQVYEIAADEAGGAGDEKGFSHTFEIPINTWNCKYFDL